MSSDEITRLRAEVEAYRQRELADLRAALAAAREEAAHFRAEAQRNADVGRQIAAAYREQVETLRRKLEALTHPPPTQRTAHAARR